MDQAGCFILGIGLLMFGCGLGGMVGWFNPQYQTRNAGCVNMLALVSIFFGSVFLITVIN